MKNFMIFILKNTDIIHKIIYSVEKYNFKK